MGSGLLAALVVPCLSHYLKAVQATSWRDVSGRLLRSFSCIQWYPEPYQSVLVLRGFMEVLVLHQWFRQAETKIAHVEISGLDPSYVGHSKHGFTIWAR